MDLEELFSTYVLCDGEISSLKLVFDYLPINNKKQTYAFIALKVRKKVAQNKFERCVIELRFENISKFSLYEDFIDSIDYSDIVFKKLETGLLYFSVDPYGNSNEPNENDNFVIVAESFKIKEIVE